jgi:hypothetical protein
MLIKKFPQLLFCYIYSISLPTYWTTHGSNFNWKYQILIVLVLDQRLIKIAKNERNSENETLIKTYSQAFVSNSIDTIVMAVQSTTFHENFKSKC